MKKLFTMLLCAALCAPVALAQDASIYQRREIVEIENDDGDTTQEIIAMDLADGSHYYLNLGKMGFGNKIVQVQLDPVYNLYIKLGDSLEEASATLDDLLIQMKGKVGTETVVTGYLNIALPGEDGAEKVTITNMKPVLGRYLQFSVERDGYIRATSLRKSELRTLIFNLKAYRKFHKKEK